MQWSDLLSNQRLVDKNKKEYYMKKYEDRGYIGDFEDDFLDIVSNHSFRKLQDKAQVFPLEKGDYVRTRLTHSMEVSTVARYIARMILDNLKNTQSAKPNKIETELETISMFEQKVEQIVACAGLLHDIGNPPYGHQGEGMIRKWFKDFFASETYISMGIKLDEVMEEDLKNFEGNAQALRILSKCRFKGEENDKFTDLNVTYAVMNTLIKYPNSSLDFGNKAAGVNGKNDKDDVKKHKNGYYHAERDVIEKICSQDGHGTGTYSGEEGYVRHPLVYIMEAADDISYCISDLEDAASKGCFKIDEFIEHYKMNAKKYVKELQYPLEEQRNRIPQKEEREKNKPLLEEYNRLTDQIIEETDEAQKEELLKQRKDIRKQLSKKLRELAEKGEKSYDILQGDINKLQKVFDSARTRGIESDFEIFESWAAGLRNGLMYGAAYTFVKNYEKIMEGSYMGELFTDAFVEPTLKVLKSTMPKFVYENTIVETANTEAKEIMQTLLDCFVYAALKYDGDESLSDMNIADRYYVEKIPYHLRQDYMLAKKQKADQVAEGSLSQDAYEREKLYLKLLMVTDFISGMTDSYAQSLSRAIKELKHVL